MLIGIALLLLGVGIGAIGIYLSDRNLLLGLFLTGLLVGTGGTVALVIQGDERRSQEEIARMTEFAQEQAEAVREQGKPYSRAGLIATDSVISKQVLSGEYKVTSDSVGDQWVVEMTERGRWGGAAAVTISESGTVTGVTCERLSCPTVEQINNPGFSP